MGQRVGAVLRRVHVGVFRRKSRLLQRVLAHLLAIQRLVVHQFRQSNLLIAKL